MVLRVVIRAVFTLVMMSVLLQAGIVNSQDVPSTQEPVFRVAYGEFPPYASTDSDGVVSGYAVDLMRRLAEQAGYSVEFVRAANPTRMLEMLDAGTVDATTLLAITPQRQSAGHFTLPIGVYQNALFVPSGSGIEVFGDLSGGVIGAVHGSFAAREVRKAVPDAQVIEYDDLDDMILPLLNGRIDAIVSPSEPFVRTLRSADLEQRVRQLESAVSEAPRAFLFRHELSGLRNRINMVIRRDISEAELEALSAKWFGKPRVWLDDPVIRIAVGLVAVALILTVIAVLVAVVLHRRATMSFAESRHNKMLVDALNGINAAVVIYDSQFRAVHCNDGFIATFPTMLPLIRSGMSMPDLIARSYQNGVTEEQKDPAEAEMFARQIIEHVQLGEECARTVRMSDGRVFDAIEFPIGPDMYASVRTDVTRLHRQMEEISTQKELLGVLNEKLQTFSSIAAHDLKAPVRQTTMAIRVVREELEMMDIEMTEDCSEFLTMSEHSLHAMGVLIDDLLTYARAENAGDIAITLSPEERLDDLAALLAVPATFELSIAPDLPDVHVPPAGFDLVMRNLISNAIKHHDRESGRIEVRARISGALAIFEIEDDGPGIPEQYRERIFAPFQRLSATTPGSGLGLSAVQKTIESWGGTVMVQAASDDDTRGSVFSFTVPCPQEPSMASPYPSFSQEQRFIA